MSSTPARIEQILTIDMGTNMTHCFLLLRPSTEYAVDHVTGLRMYQISDDASCGLFGLPALRGKKQWLVPVNAVGTEFSISAKATTPPAGQRFLHVDWIARVALLF